MFFGRESYRNPAILLEMLGEDSVESKASSKWLQPFLKAYIYLFGLPDVGFQLRSLYFRRHVATLRPSTVLDAGCGLGFCSFYLAKKYPGAKIDACDYDPHLVEASKTIKAQLGLDNVNVFQADVSLLAEVDKYDLVIHMDVLDQIQDDQEAIRGFHTALKDDGILYLTIPHQRHTERYLTRFEWVSDKRHVRKGYTEHQLTELLQSSGFTIRKIKNIWGFFGEGCMELYVWALMHLPLPLAALAFPPLSAISSLDMITRNRQGYGLLVVAEKRQQRLQGGSGSGDRSSLPVNRGGR